MMNINLNSPKETIVKRDLIKHSPMVLPGRIKVDTVSFTGKDQESPKLSEKLSSLIDAIKVPLLMLMSFINSMFDTFKSIFAVKDKHPKVDENEVKQDYEKLEANKIFKVLEKALKPDLTNESRVEIASKLAKEFSYVELTEAYGQSHKLLTELGKEDLNMDNAQEILREASFIAQNAYFDDIKGEVKQQISIILDREIEKLPLLDKDKEIVLQAREKMADDQKFFETIFTTAFIDLKPEDNLSYECLAFLNNWE